MATKFQNQLIGAVIIIALGIILLPYLLDGKKTYQADKFTSIPLMPNVKDQSLITTTTQPIEQPPIVDTTKKEDKQLTLSPGEIGAIDKKEQSISNTVVSKNKTPDSHSLPPKGKAYVIQLGALNNVVKANEIIAKLRLGGFNVYTLPSTPIQGKLTRIYIGPELSKQSLQAKLSELERLTALKGVIRPYQP